MARIINRLTTNYESFPLDYDEHLPRTALQLWAHVQNPTRELINSFVTEVSTLDCFSYRAFKDINGEIVFWNSLHQPFLEFSNSATKIYQADTGYPTPDMVKLWVRHQEGKQG